MCVYMYIYIYIYIHTYIYVYTYTDIYIHICIYTYTHNIFIYMYHDCPQTYYVIDMYMCIFMKRTQIQTEAICTTSNLLPT